MADGKEKGKNYTANVVKQGVGGVRRICIETDGRNVNVKECSCSYLEVCEIARRLFEKANEGGSL